MPGSRNLAFSCALVSSADILPPGIVGLMLMIFRPTPAGGYYLGISAAAPIPNTTTMDALASAGD
jgi:hypothetical protein